MFIYIIIIIMLGSTPLYGTTFGRGPYPIILGELYCSGQESSLLECNRNDRSISTCSTNEVAGIRCEGNVVNANVGDGEVLVSCKFHCVCRSL